MSNSIKVAFAEAMVRNFFEGDWAKTKLWFETPNPLLGNVSPNTMIRLGKEDKLLSFIKAQKEGYGP